jgi:hypothetical protein
MNRTIGLAALLLLGGCATQGTHEGMSWRDGSWYSPARDGHGDYYTANPHHAPDAYDVPWAWSVGFVPFGGYCPAAYRYCTSFWADPWYSAAWDPWYYPFAYVPPRHHAHPAPPSQFDAASVDHDPFDAPQAPTEREPREPGHAWGGRQGSGRAPMHERRRAAADGGRD